MVGRPFKAANRDGQRIAASRSDAMKPHLLKRRYATRSFPQSSVPPLKRRPTIKRRYATRGAEKIAIARIGSRQKGQKSSLTVARELGESDVVARGIFNAEFAGAVER